MAKRRKKAVTHRRRRVGAVGSNDVKTVVGTVAGILAGRLLSTKLGATLNPKIMAAVQLLGGGVVAIKAKNPLLKGIGYGLAANGALTGAQSFGVISGIAGTPLVFTNRSIQGSYSVPRVGNTTVNDFPKPATVGNTGRMRHQSAVRYGSSY